MQLHEDLARRTLVQAAALPWVASPAAGVERRMLFRIGDETARATSIVRYAAGSHFARHVHPGGEEFLVLEGTFEDERGAYPAGSYVRNPPGSAHAPGSASGCTIFVRLWQFRATDGQHIVRRPGEAAVAPARPGVATSRRLFADAAEQVMLEDWQANRTVRLDNGHGLELLVLAGGFDDGHAQLARWSWLRLPAGAALTARTGPQGARVWWKAAPLLHADVCAFAAGQDAAP